LVIKKSIGVGKDPADEDASDERAGRFAAQKMNAQPVADARCVSETWAARVPGPKKEPTRQQIENAAPKTPAKPEDYCFSERLKEARCPRNYRMRSTLRRTRDGPWACAVFRAVAANSPGSTPQKRRTKR